ncbi:BEL1-like homeodomain protein 8 [Abrus precatorius]|uniref:BEL1-like homeodomain protein 8 n=1 Tax=Abrus precatorius TaxID=3816 RepID=A0A8B8KTV0_ABRPR|nr:BEL1-like homeodomain protein 8 [Abrus precatorius]XP_027346015.1 BEL1-like homeodomain protein 8 [Abrus precatorius]XP_027346016.1 BEL1-like homeodomain protein 8 [Abrus precatorius]XP_027346017.1 BEL1-like homeodomain protein 8 [Abrus precatorius]
MSSLRPELHVAQQIRRDKLRIQNSSQHFQEFPNNLEQLTLHPGFNLDLLPVRNNVRNGNMLDAEEALYPSEMISFSTASNPLSAPRNPLECTQELMMAQYGSFPHSSAKEQCEPRNNLGNWRNSAPHQVSDWMVNYNESNPNSFLTSELNNNREIQKQLGEMHYTPSSSSPLYHNALQDMASLMHDGVWGGNHGEPVVHPSFGHQANSEFRFGSANLWTNSSMGFTDKKVVNEQDTNPQGLSLSLSSNSQSKPSFEEGSASDDPQYSKSVKTTMKPNVNIPRSCGKSLQDSMVMPLNNSATYRNVGPLGPFTGYATILKSSKFMKPCQQLLDQWCCHNGSKFTKGGACDVVPEWVSRDVSAASTSAADAVSVDESGVAAKGVGISGASSSVLYSSNENSADGGAASSFCLSSRPACQKNKAKLLYMQEEVTRRYKQYHQQMQMVVQSFESVAGLSSATPYISLALKSVSKNFRCLKSAISDQLKLTCEVLGEDFSLPTTSTSNKFDTNMARLRYMDQSFQKNKSGGPNVDFLEPQQHVWRPQRGLPERSVAILKAWLFEHFLHPYPTDTDKHMLATQTGLSRNQVSNWFINARVRVWKPMVEEIHMLETKGAAEAHQNTSKNNDQVASASEGSNQPKVDHQPVNKFGTHAHARAIAEKQFQCLEMGSSSSAGNEENIGMDGEQWNEEKRSKLECQINTTPSLDGTVMGFMPYRRGGLEVGGIGSVSLTLGLRHGVEGVQQQQLHQEDELRRQFGGHMIRDFVG